MHTPSSRSGSSRSGAPRHPGNPGAAGTPAPFAAGAGTNTPDPGDPGPGPLHPADPARLAGHRLLGRLPADPPGTCYLARSVGGVLMTLRVVPHPWSAHTEFRSAFARGTASAQRVVSRWAVAPVAADIGCRLVWLAEPYLPDPDLAMVVAARGPLPRDIGREVGARLAEALETVHRAGLVHACLTPARVLLAPDGPRLTGLGLAGALYGAGPLILPPSCLAPEQAEEPERRPGPPADVFALGCVLTHAVTGRLPFGAAPAGEVRRRILSEPPDLADVPRGLLEVIGACLDRDPELRPTPAELCSELDPRAGGGGDPGGVRLPDDVLDLITRRRAVPPPDAPPARAPLDGTRRVGSGDPGADPGRHPFPGAEDRPGPVETGDGAGRSGDTARGPSRRGLLLLVAGSATAAAGGAGVLFAGRARSGAPPAEAARSLLIGVHADLTGADAGVGRAQELGVRLAVEELADLARLPFDVDVRVVDDGGDPGRAAEAARELGSDPAVRAVIGPTGEASARPAAEQYARAGLPLLALSPAEFPEGDRTLLHARPDTAAQALAVVHRLHGEPGVRRVGLVDDRAAEPISGIAVRAVTGALDRDRITPVPRVLPVGAGDPVGTVAGLLAEGIDGVVHAGRADAVAALAVALADAGFTGPRIAWETALREEFPRRAGQAAEGWLLVAPRIDPARAPEAVGFTTVFRKRFEEEPEPWAAEAYDAARLLVETVRRMGTQAPPDREMLLTRLRSARLRGVAKPLAFAADGRFSAGDEGAYWYEVRDGEFHYLGKASMAGA
ncbi:ABC transporter substrate-binding protein [Streptomyces sp. ST2-7A]|uniref:ABC transporter substrate-binding protein n=1 Tax=Streptomyces sp. ST2-7A TaxID=2907214 RepID=UPI001F187B19|nr:ABC transporter substrate-binding protein [Streptomyces sp. ST2-7A]MCE7081051.1 ABC transporter substrate-binding protein [Streptomyces sp. ST2-7A]